MTCSECNREIGYHEQNKDGKPVMIMCWRTGNAAEVRT